jgi:hypothetical protein
VLALAGSGEAGTAPRIVDVVLADVDGRVVTASDVALARALGLFGFAPAARGAPIDAADVDRLVGVELVLLEARRLGITATAGDVEAEWPLIAARFGSPPALEAWLDESAVERDWARRVAGDDIAWRRFVDARFRAFAFVAPADLAAALGPGPHDPAAEARAVERLRERQTQERLAAWIRERVAAARVRRLLGEGERVPSPFE